MIRPPITFSGTDRRAEAGPQLQLASSASALSMQPPPHRALRSFRRTDLHVAERIGKGAYGGVWQATVRETGQAVAVKVIWPDPDLDSADAKRESPGEQRRAVFKREIEMLRRIGRHRHANIVEVLGATADATVIVFEEALTDLHAIVKKQRVGPPPSEPGLSSARAAAAPQR